MFTPLEAQQLLSTRGLQSCRSLVEIVLVCLAVVFTCAQWMGLLLVVDAGLVSLPLVAFIASAAVVAMHWPRGVHRTAGHYLRVVISGMVIASATLGWGAVAFNHTTYRVLSGASDDGCRVVVEQRSGWAGGAGTIYLVAGGTGFPHKVASYSTDNDLRPFSDGSARVVWHGNRATVEGLSIFTRSGSQNFSC